MKTKKMRMVMKRRKKRRKMKNHLIGFSCDDNGENESFHEQTGVDGH